MINLLDDTPIVPGDAHPVFEGTEAARQVLNDAEDDLRHWQPSHEPIYSSAGNLGVGAMPGNGNGIGNVERTARSRSGSNERRVASGESLGSNYGGEVKPPHHMTEAEEKRQVAEAGFI